MVIIWSIPHPKAPKSTSTTINFASSNNTTITTTNRNIKACGEWVAVGGCLALGGDVSCNSRQLLDGSDPNETTSDDFR